MIIKTQRGWRAHLILWGMPKTLSLSDLRDNLDTFCYMCSMSMVRSSHFCVTEPYWPGVCFYAYEATCNMLLLQDIQVNYQLALLPGALGFDDWNHFDLTVASQEYALHMNSHMWHVIFCLWSICFRTELVDILSLLWNSKMREYGEEWLKCQQWRRANLKIPNLKDSISYQPSPPQKNKQNETEFHEFPTSTDDFNKMVPGVSNFGNNFFQTLQK